MSTAQERPGRPTRLGPALRDTFDVLVDAARAIVRHWPVLLVLALLGVAVRGAVQWVAVDLSDHVSWLAQLLLVLAPLGYLLPVIAMMHVCGRSMPHVQALRAVPAPDDATAGRERRLVDVMVSVLVPFLAVYVSYGLLAQDIQSFTNAAAFEEFNQVDFAHPVVRDYYDRVGLYPLRVVVMIVAVAWVLRWALGRFEQRTRFLALAFVGALVEVYYSGQVAGQLDRLRTATDGWLESRRASHWAIVRYDDVTGRLGPLAHPVDAVTTWLFGVLGSFDSIVVVPLAWLTVGAVVLGHQLAPPPSYTHPVLDRLSIVPAPLRRALGSLTSDVRERFGAFFNGLRLMARAGLVPMVLFCVAFLLALRVPYLVQLAIRAVVGPRDTRAWLDFAPLEDALGLALSMVVLSALLAAAIDRLVMPAVSEAAARRTPEASTTAGPS